MGQVWSKEKMKQAAEHEQAPPDEQPALVKAALPQERLETEVTSGEEAILATVTEPAVFEQLPAVAEAVGEEAEPVVETIAVLAEDGSPQAREEARIDPVQDASVPRWQPGIGLSMVTLGGFLAFLRQTHVREPDDEEDTR